MDLDLDEVVVHADAARPVVEQFIAGGSRLSRLDVDRVQLDSLLLRELDLRRLVLVDVLIGQVADVAQLVI